MIRLKMFVTVSTPPAMSPADDVHHLVLRHEPALVVSGHDEIEQAIAGLGPPADDEFPGVLRELGHRGRPFGLGERHAGHEGVDPLPEPRVILQRHADQLAHDPHGERDEEALHQVRARAGRQDLVQQVVRGIGDGRRPGLDPGGMRALEMIRRWRVCSGPTRLRKDSTSLKKFGALVSCGAPASVSTRDRCWSASAATASR